jgi:hypothetical protein
MTTFVLNGGVLAADTRLTISGGDAVRFDVADKLRISPWAVSTGAGAQASVLCLSTTPNLLALRWLGVGAYPFFGLRAAAGQQISVLVVWRTGHVWSFYMDIHRWGFLVWARVRSHWATHLRTDPVAKGGAGAEAFSLDDLEDLGIEACLAKAALLGNHTGIDHTSFDTIAWDHHHVPPSLRMNRWQRWKRAFQLWRTALTSAHLPPHEAPHGHDSHTDGTGDHV